MKLFLVTFLFIPSIAFGQLTGGDRFADDAGDLNPPVQQDDGSSGGGTTAIDATGGYSATQQGGLEGANQGASNGGLVAALGAAMGAGFTAACFSCSPSPCWGYCAMAAMSFADAASGAGANAAGVSTGNHLNTDWGSFDGTDLGLDPITVAEIQDGAQQLQDSGVVVNSNGTVTTPNGETYSSSDFSSAEDMIAKGMSPGAAAKAAKQISDIKNEAAKKAGVNLDDLAGDGNAGALAGVGGAIGGAGSAVGDNAFGTGGGGGGDTVIEEVEYRGGKKGKNNRLPASQAALLSKDFNGDPIGIGMGDLFLRVKLKYKQKIKQKAFFTKEY